LIETIMLVALGLSTLPAMDFVLRAIVWMLEGEEQTPQENPDEGW